MVNNQSKNTTIALELLRDNLLFQDNRKAEALVAKDLYDSLDTRSVNDSSFPWTHGGSFGKNATKTYYYQNEPTEAEFAHVARHFPMGNRLTFGRAKDDWQNNFRLEFPRNDFDPKQIEEINTIITQHYNKNKFYLQGKRATALDYVQGESLLWRFREGDGVVNKEDLIKSQLAQFALPEDPTKPILFYMAIDKIDYQPVGSEKAGYFYYSVNFYDKNDASTSFNVHPSRVTRWRSEEWDYEQNKGYSKLLPCFGQLTILQQICFSMGNAIERYGHGFPFLLLKNAQNKTQLAKIASMVGDLSARSWLMMPKEMVESFEFKGVGGTAMNFQEAIDSTIDQVASGSQIPIDILLGRTTTISRDGEVIDRNYFGTLDKDHAAINPFIMENIELDPFMQGLFRFFGIKYYVINWGLKQVMTEIEEANLKMRQYTNVASMMRYAFFIECRKEAGLPSIQEKFAKLPNGTKLCNDLYGIDPINMDYMIPDLGVFKQQMVLEQTEPKIEAEKNEQMLAENNNPENKARSEGTSKPTNAGTEKSTEARRSEQKKARSEADIKLEEAEKEIESLKASMGARDMMFNEMLESLQNVRHLKDAQDRELSTYQLAETVDIPRSTLCNILNRADLVKKK
jgi:molecular chaperone GrpE (heat shock protein)